VLAGLGGAGAGAGDGASISGGGKGTTGREGGGRGARAGAGGGGPRGRPGHGPSISGGGKGTTGREGAGAVGPRALRVTSRDRTGLLSSMCEAMARAGIDIADASIETHGDVVRQGLTNDSHHAMTPPLTQEMRV